MGIKTLRVNLMVSDLFTLKNLPTTWGLRHHACQENYSQITSEKPPHHMGIKTCRF